MDLAQYGQRPWLVAEMPKMPKMPEMPEMPKLPEMPKNDITGRLKHVQCHVTNFQGVVQEKPVTVCPLVNTGLFLYSPVSHLTF